jgi:hypothetical protein
MIGAAARMEVMGGDARDCIGRCRLKIFVFGEARLVGAGEGESVRSCV